jgi:hypothetical protein
VDRRWWIALAVGLAFAFAALLNRHLFSDGDAVISNGSAAPDRAALRSPPDGAVESRITQPTGGRTGLQSAAGSIPERDPHRAPPISYQTQMDDPLRLPRSEEEAAWFDAHGYPSHEAFDEATKTFGEAEFFDQATSLTALNVARAEHFAIAFPGEATSAIAFLERAAASGSIYALEALSRVHANPMTGNPVTSAAYLYAAEMRGNWGLAAPVMRPPLAPEQRFLAGLYAHEIIAEINRTRRATGRPELDFSPRPGLGELLREVEAAMDADAAPGGG